MKIRLPGFWMLLAGCAATMAADGPPSTAPAKGELSGILKTTAKLVRVVAVDRAWADVLNTSRATAKDDFVYEGNVEQATGAFRVPGLIAGRPYDLIAWTQDAQGKMVRWEGANMDYHRAILPSTPVTAEDRKAIEALVVDPQQFYDKVRVLRMAADHQHATVLVELMRTRDFHSDTGGELIYRVELWYFENLFGGWAKDANTEKVLARVRGKPGELPENWQFLPELGGVVAGPAPGTSATAGMEMKVGLPEKPEPKRGRAAH